MARLASLSREETALLNGIAARTVDVAPGTALYVQGEELRNPGALMAGWAFTKRRLGDGRRQIFRFVLPGDLFGLRFRIDSLALDTLVTLTPCKIADASSLIPVVSQSYSSGGGLALACSMSASLDDSYGLDHIVRLGQQTAYERLAHLILELANRLKTVGLTDGSEFYMPLTQDILADVLGLSLVHVNRTLQHLRREHVIEFKGFNMKILDLEKLTGIAGYRPPKVAPHPVI
jgi:CRP-like cAMP-binding protein